MLNNVFVNNRGDHLNIFVFDADKLNWLVSHHKILLIRPLDVFIRNIFLSNFDVAFSEGDLRNPIHHGDIKNDVSQLISSSASSTSS